MGPEHTNYGMARFVPLNGGEPVELGPIRDVAFIPSYGKPVKVVFENGSCITTIASPDDIFMIPTENEAALNSLDLMEVL